MAITKGAGYQFIFGTSAQFAALQTANKVVDGNLYFITDTKQIYVGNDLYAGTVEFVSAFPEAPSQGVIYVNKTTQETKVYNGTSWDVMVPAVVSAITADTADTALVNAKAVKDYISGTAEAAASAVSGVTYDKATQQFTVTYADANKTASTLSLANLITGVTYENGKLTFAKPNKAEGESDIEISLPTEQFLSAANYNDETHELELHLNTDADGDYSVTVNLEDLIDVYTVDDTSSVDLTLTGNKITAVVKTSATTGNILTLNEDGLFVPGDYIQSVADTNSVTLSVSDGSALTADVKISTEDNNALTVKTTEGKEGLFVDLSGKQDKLTDAQLTAISDVANKADKSTTYTKTEVDALLTWKEIELPST